MVNSENIQIQNEDQKNSVINNDEFEKKLKHEEIRSYISCGIGLTILAGGTFFIAPTFPIFFGTVYQIIQEMRQTDIVITPEMEAEYEKEERLFLKKVNRSLKQMERRRFISLEQIDDKLYIHVLDKGKSEILTYSLREILKRKYKSQKWRNGWYMVIFDVPENERVKRDYMRRFLLSIGFKQYQKSVYIFPFECIKEIKWKEI